MLVLSGCRPPYMPAAAAPQHGSAYYHQLAGKVPFPDAANSAVADAHSPMQPYGESRAIRRPSEVPHWNISRADAIQLALANCQFVRTNDEFLSPSNILLSNSNVAPSIFDVPIQETEILSGQRGVQAALSDFDPRLFTSMNWNRDELIQNNSFLSGGVTPGGTLVTEAAAFESRLSKFIATGGEISLSTEWDYLQSNAPGQLFDSVYTGNVGVGFRQPLWAGSGTEFTSIAGPEALLNQRISGLTQGVLISRLNENISVIEFETRVRDLVRDVDNVYWDLYLAYRSYEVEEKITGDSEKIWKDVKAKLETGIEGGSAADEAQAAEEYFASKARAETALSTLWDTEDRLRRLLGLPVDDRLIRPCDQPESDQMVPSWNLALLDAFCNRLELRKQKNIIRSLQLQVRAARSMVNPRLDFISGYRVNGFGDRLIASNDDDGITDEGLRSAFGTLTQGDQTGWNLGLQFSLPFGLRAERMQACNLELQLAKARAALAQQELEISHELANAFNLLNRWQQVAKTSAERVNAADRRVSAFAAEYSSGRASLDLLLRARVSQAQSQIEHHRSVAEYNKSLSNVEYRKGTLLEWHQVLFMDQFYKTAPPPQVKLEPRAVSSSQPPEQQPFGSTSWISAAKKEGDV